MVCSIRIDWYDLKYMYMDRLVRFAVCRLVLLVIYEQIGMACSILGKVVWYEVYGSTVMVCSILVDWYGS